MSKTNAITNNTVIIREAGGPEIRWRTQRMVSLGADAELAAKIAHSEVDVHDIARLLNVRPEQVGSGDRGLVAEC